MDSKMTETSTIRALFEVYKNKKHRGKPVDVFAVAYIYNDPHPEDPASGMAGFWDVMAGCAGCTPADGRDKEWAELYDLLYDERIEATWLDEDDMADYDFIAIIIPLMTDPRYILKRVRRDLREMSA